MAEYTTAAYCDPDTCPQYGTTILNTQSSSSCIAGDCSHSSISQSSKAASSSETDKSTVSSALSTIKTHAKTTEPTHSVFPAIKTTSASCNSGTGCTSSSDDWSGIPDGAKIGIGIGAGMGMILVIVLLVFLFPKRQRRQIQKRLGLGKAVEADGASGNDLTEPQEVKGSSVHELSSESQVAEMNGERG